MGTDEADDVALVLPQRLTGAGDLHLRVTGPVAYLSVGAADPAGRPTGVDGVGPALARVGAMLTGDVRMVLLRISGLSGASWPDDSSMDWLRRNDVVSMAVVDGQPTGDVLAAVCACDLRVLSADSTLYFPGLTENGLPPGIARLAELVGGPRALALCLNGRSVSATEAQRFGLAEWVVDSATVDATVEGVVAAVLRSSRTAIAELKAVLSTRHDSRLLEAEQTARARLLSDRDGMVG